MLVKLNFFLFKSPKKQTDISLNLKHNEKGLYETKSMKYLGMKIDRNLIWKQQIIDVAIELNKANASLVIKLRHFFDMKSLKLICHVKLELDLLL